MRRIPTVLVAATAVLLLGTAAASAQFLTKRLPAQPALAKASEYLLDEDRPLDPAAKAALLPADDGVTVRGTTPPCNGTATTLLYPFTNDGSWTQSMARNDDGSSALIALGFTYTLYSSSYTSCYINNNGNLTFTGPSGIYNPVGFPDSTPRVAPFWADVDTRSWPADGIGTGLVWHKIIDSNGDTAPDTLIVTWDNVGVYNQYWGRRDTFQVAISDGTNPFMGLGNTTCFSYDNMCWTTGAVTPGFDGNYLGGGGATVGVNEGGGAGNFAQYGRFGAAGNAYDGPFGAVDGVDHLDGIRLCFSTGVGNACPISSGFPVSGTVTMNAGDTLTLNVAFASPEAGQTTTVAISDPDGAQSHGLGVTNTAGNVATVALSWTTDCADVGTYHLTFDATDDFATPCTTTETLTIVVNRTPACTGTTISIDVFPFFSPLANRVYLSRATRKVPVLVLGSAAFNAADLNPATARFGPTGSEAAPMFAPSFADYNGDGFVDALYDFRTGDCGFALADTTGTLNGTTFGGTAVSGSDSVAPAP